MKNTLYILSLVLLPAAAFSQSTAKDPQNIAVNATRDPEYPKGEKVLYEEVRMKVKYPEEAIKKYIEGEVSLSFDVKADSTVANCIIVSGVGYGVDEAVKAYVEKLKFSPGRMNGMKVKMNVNMNFPVKAH
ncbi:MAG TPA: energy transducer TonB [Bacteroidia bacterium]|jgi:TonB family protein|nr:energy transducer TonB [Bacteroidia bacterium]